MQIEIKPEHFDITKVLYDQYGALALGWVVAFAEGLYIIALHRRIVSIYREAVGFARQAAADMLPVLSKNTEVMQTVVIQQDEIADNVSAIRNDQTASHVKIELFFQNYFKNRR